MCRGVESIVAAEPGWRQVITKVEGDKRIFKVAEVTAWAVAGEDAFPLGPNGELRSDFDLVEVVPPFCGDSDQDLLQRALSKVTLH